MLYKNIEDYPFRASMRRSTKDGYYWHYNYGSKLNAFFTWLDNFLESCVGKPLNYAYSALCKRYPNYLGRINPRKMFRRYIEYDYLVDDDGIIRKKDRYRRERRCIKVPVKKVKTLYKFNWWSSLNHKYLYNVLSAKEIRVILKTGNLSSIQYTRILESPYWEKLKDNIDVTETYEYETYLKGTRQYSKLRAEAQDRTSKQIREIEKDQKEKTSKLLHSRLYNDKISRKKKQQEIKRLQREEELRNIIDRDRLGFDEESFMGPNYNSRKGKKLKRLLNDKINQLRESGNNNPSLR